MVKSGSKSVTDSSIEQNVYRIFPNDLNSNGTAFGGLVVALLDRLALVVAERHSGKTCVTASIDSVHFLAPAKEGENLLLSASVNRVWSSSMEIGTKVYAENPTTSDKRHIVSAYFTFVAMDSKNKPTTVPPLLLKTLIEQRRFEEAGVRRDRRREEAAKWKKARL